MSTTTTTKGNESHEKEELIDITALIRRCASEGLSYSHPFTPLAKKDAATAALATRQTAGDNDGEGVGGGSGSDDAAAKLVTDGTLLEGLHIQGTSIANAGGKEQNTINESDNAAATTLKLNQLDLQDAMTALELGDKRMDCCEIPLDGQGLDGSKQLPSLEEEVTFPPRIAPTSLSDGTPCYTLSLSSHTSDTTCCASSNKEELPSNTLLLPATPTPSLLPHWNTLSLSPSESSSSILPLLLLQLTALEAYIGTNNGGSNAAETLYCMMWCHDGILVDMAERLGVGLNNNEDDGADCIAERVSKSIKRLEEQLEQNGTPQHENDHDAQELNVAQWVLFASSLGVVRIAETVRWVVVNADFYEEEDFGVALHGGKATAQEEVERNEEGKPTTSSSAGDRHTKKKGGSSMRFCPTLQGSSYIEVVWDTALSHLRRYRSSLHASKVKQGSEKKSNHDETLDALENILTAQQSFFQGIKILSNLNDETVRDFTTIAARRAKETAGLFEKLRDMDVVKLWSENGLIARDGRLLHTIATPETPNESSTLDHIADQSVRTNLLLSASFDPFINRRLLGNAPVRKACFRPPNDVLTSLSQLAAELDWGVCEPILNGNSFGRITRMLENNSLRGCGGVVPIAVPKKVPKKEAQTNGGTKKTVSSKGPGVVEEGGLETETPMGMNILSRSLLVLNLYFDDKLFGQYDFSEMVGQHMKQQCAVPDLLLTSTDWLTRMAKPMYDTLKALCLNRHRERGFTESILLPAFQVLQYEAANVDDKFRMEHGLDAKTTSYATNYVIVNTIRLMERHVGLGIELGLYPNWYDLSSSLWYRDFLLSALINVKGSIERERMQRREMDLRIKQEEEDETNKTAKQQDHQQHQPHGKKKGKTKKGKKSKHQQHHQQQQQQSTALSQQSNNNKSTAETNAKLTAEDFEDRLEYTSLLLHRNLCRGLVRYIAALRQANLLPDPPSSITMFTTHQKRFEKRFEAFSTLPQPPSLSYEDYLRGSDFSAVQSKDLLSAATDCFRSGKGVVDWLLDVIVAVPSSSVNGNAEGDDTKLDETEKRRDDDLYISIHRDEIMALAKVCVTNSLFLHKLSSMSLVNGGQKSGNKGCGGDVSLDFKIHKLYCTLSIT